MPQRCYRGKTIEPQRRQNRANGKECNLADVAILALLLALLERHQTLPVDGRHCESVRGETLAIAMAVAIDLREMASQRAGKRS